MYEFKMKFCEMVRGASAYEVAARNGFEGTEAEWVAALEGGAKDAQTAAQQAAAEAQAAAGRAGKTADSAGENADAAAASAEAAALSAAMARSHAVTAETRAADAQQARADAIAAAGDAAAATQAAQSAAVDAAEAGTKATQAAQSAAAEANRAFQTEQSIKQYESSAAASKTAAARSAADAARSAKAAKQSDWNAAEDEAGHILNRPFYTEGGGGGEVIFPETTLTLDDDGMAVLQDPVALTVGEKYIVGYNGVEYETVAVEHTEDGMTGTALGNLGAMTGGADTGEPFIMIVLSADSAAGMGLGGMFASFDGATSVTVSITSCSGETIHKLDNKYLDLEWLPTEEKIQCIEKQTIACEWPNSGSYGGIIRVPQIADGEKLIVVVDGKEFRCTAEVAPYMTQYYWIKIGNRALTESGEDTGEPFYIDGNSLDSYGFFHITKGTHTVEVYRNEPNKMPAEFLPESVPLLFNVPFTIDLVGMDATCDYTFAEVYAKAKNLNTIVRGVLQITQAEGGVVFASLSTASDGAVTFVVPEGVDSTAVQVFTVKLLSDDTCEMIVTQV